MNKNPKIKVKPSQFTKTLEIVNYFLIIVFWIITSLAYKHLPEEIPTHYNGLGEVDAYGDKITIFFLPLIASILFVTLTITANKPYWFNYSETITAENVETQYKNAMRFMQSLNLFVLLIFIFIDYKTIQIALNKSGSLGVWFLPLTGIVGISIIIYSVKQSKKENI
ncbi:DUF1648 domain-containing protein [Paenimyroides tangerinum]|uniref:DUF1648 domain-containing protein n=1 Tax=Paenimyroides tangerinum TaxID=2488728 RepID=A0A3P3W7L2_9FLAO|nr:DUF1648 domain-containing protein [Paenimyroides tangerinum]RRJ91162.1 DUF1648 domain-containing protein [Paenimyroides tangerinum]